MDDLSVGVGIFYVPDFNDIYNVQYVFMNQVILHEMRKTREEVFGYKIIEVAPEAYESDAGRMVIETYVKFAREKGSTNLGLVEYSNHLVAGIYECSVHHIQEHYVYVQLRNVTALEKALQENKALEQFNHITSHDLQEPLNSIISFSKLLEKEKHKMGAIGKQSIEAINVSTLRMKDFITDLLEYSKIGAEKERTEVEIPSMIEQLKIDLHHLMIEKNAVINYVGELSKIHAFEHELFKLFQNLIVNSIKYTGEETSPEVTINAIEKEKWFEFSVEDNGIGIPEDQHDKIFEIFQRLHSRSKYSGTGIGLSICRKIVKLHDGEIWLTSQVGKGTTFYFTLSKP